MITAMQITPEEITLGCWLIFLVYWLASAAVVKPIQQTRGWLGGNWYRLLLLPGFLLLLKLKFLARFGPPLTSLWAMPVPPSLTLDGAGAILTVAGLGIAIVARRTLAGNWSGAVALKEGHELITTGVYGLVRHPIYSGMLLMVVGTAVSADTLGACLGLLVIVGAVVLKLRQEEALLSEYFGTAYQAYRQRTKILIPHIW